MKIWHVGAATSPDAVNGVNALVYTLAEEQLKMGDDVSLLLEGTPDDAASAFSRRTGAKFIVVPTSIYQYQNAVTACLKESAPDIVHMHSVFTPHQALLARVLMKIGIPYLVTPHGGFAPQILTRNRLKKSIYSSLIERPRVRGAAGISALTPSEVQEIRLFVPDFRGVISCIPNAVDPDSLNNVTWVSKCEKPKLVFLGRFDIKHKGIDILIAIARHLPDMDFHLFGVEDPKTRSELETLKRNSTQNVFFHDPVFGSEKAAVLAAATLYIQSSRWDAFPISIVEAMFIGLPCAIASTLHLARFFECHDLGLVFQPDPMRASAAIREALGDLELLMSRAARAQKFARQNFLPAAVAQRFHEFYQSSISSLTRSERVIDAL
jgi:glycosyltransferase involved in cell wall biosynthesis